MPPARGVLPWLPHWHGNLSTVHSCGLTASVSLKALLPLHVYVPLMSFVRCEALRKRSLYSCQECSEHSSNQDTSAHVRLQTAYSR